MFVAHAAVAAARRFEPKRQILGILSMGVLHGDVVRKSLCSTLEAAQLVHEVKKPRCVEWVYYAAKHSTNCVLLGHVIRLCSFAVSCYFRLLKLAGTRAVLEFYMEHSVRLL